MRQPAGYSQWFIGEVARAAEGGFKRAMQGQDNPTLLLCYKRGSLGYFEACPEGWRTEGDVMPLSLTLPSLIAWTHMKSTHLECLPG